MFAKKKWREMSLMFHFFGKNGPLTITVVAKHSFWLMLNTKSHQFLLTCVAREGIFVNPLFLPLTPTCYHPRRDNRRGHFLQINLVVYNTLTRSNHTHKHILSSFNRSNHTRKHIPSGTQPPCKIKQHSQPNLIFGETAVSTLNIFFIQHYLC